MTTSTYTRRTALMTVGIAAATALTGCASTLVPATTQTIEEGAASPSNSERTDFSGEAKIENYDTSAGTYEPATREHRAKNVPKPILPEEANKNSVAGLHANIAYLAAAYIYGFNSGDAECVGKSALSSEDKASLTRAIGRVSGSTWLADPTLIISLKEATPRQDGDTYTWPALLTLKIGPFRVKNRSVEEVPESERSQEFPMDIVARYKDERWVFDTLPTGSSSSSPGAGETSRV